MQKKQVAYMQVQLHEILDSISSLCLLPLCSKQLMVIDIGSAAAN
jgi:hypothetical protein